MAERNSFSTGQFAEQLGFSVPTVNRWCRDAHAGKPSRLNKHECWKGLRDWRISLDAVDRILNDVSGTIPPTKNTPLPSPDLSDE
jgi:hypothetical protein